jgi:4-amino-4-deoxy-L-arabinose transferase-like glycosyltransferase
MTAGSQKRLYILLSSVALSIATYLIFQNLATPAIRQWDEAIYADNALEMYRTGDPVVLRRNGEVTFYNTKPPLVIWFQALSMHVFGPGEFAVRFPSALSGVLVCIMLLIFSVRTLKDPRVGIIAILVLATTYGYVRSHMLKTGDLDAVLVFWTTAYALLFMHLLLQKPDNHRLFVTIGGVCVAGAFMSKGIAGFMPLPGLLICALVMKRARWLIIQRHTWLVAGGVLLFSTGFYVVRELMYPGYMYKTWFSEYTRFFDNVMSWHNHPWYYYFWNWYRLEFFVPYVFWLPVALAIGLWSRVLRKPVMLMAIYVFTFIAILSYPIVKLMWYDAAAYPFLALICASGAVALWDGLMDKARAAGSVREVLFVPLLVLLFAKPVCDMYKRNAELREPFDILEREGDFVRTLHKTEPELRAYDILMMYDQNAHYTQIDFYVNAYNRYQGYHLELITDTLLVQPGDTLACCQEVLIHSLERAFELDTVVSNRHGCILATIKQKKL